VNELAVIPTSLPSGLRAPITVTPVAKVPNAQGLSHCKASKEHRTLHRGQFDDPYSQEKIA
jgi:hypothetical protein